MHTFKKLTIGAATAGLVITGLLGATGAAGAGEEPASGGTSVPVLGSFTLTGTVVKVEGKHVTIAVDGQRRTVVVTRDALTTVVGEIKKDVQVRVATSALDGDLGLLHANGITVLSRFPRCPQRGSRCRSARESMLREIDRRNGNGVRASDRSDGFEHLKRPTFTRNAASVRGERDRRGQLCVIHSQLQVRVNTATGS